MRKTCSVYRICIERIVKIIGFLRLWRRVFLSPGCAIDDDLWYALEVLNVIDAAEFDGFFWHAEDDGAGFVLCDCLRSGHLHIVHPLCSVPAHASEENADCDASCDFCDGVEKDLD
mgnify:CR=1 FL=1